MNSRLVPGLLGVATIAVALTIAFTHSIMGVVLLVIALFLLAVVQGALLAPQLRRRPRK